MSLDLLGEGFDLHGGGIDLAFPHHENERAQAIAAGREFARRWAHNGHVQMGGEKMSKSLGNITNLTDLLASVDPRAYRLVVLQSHYRAPVEVTGATMDAATATLAGLDAFARRVADLPAAGADPEAARSVPHSDGRRPGHAPGDGGDADPGEGHQRRARRRRRRHRGPARRRGA